MKFKSAFILGWSIGFAATGAYPQAMEVTSTGVGIGTASPAAILDVQGTAIFRTSGGQEIFRTAWDGGNTGGIASPSGRGLYLTGGSGAANSQGLLIDGAGKVGIGTTGPTAKLEVIGGSNGFGLIVEGDGSSANARIALRRGNSTSATGNIDWIGNTNAVGARIGVNDDVGGSMAFKLGGSAQSDTRLFISSAGNVGIGTTDPGNKLHVRGSGGYAGLLLTNSDASGTTWAINQDSNYGYGLNFAETGVADARLFIAKSSGNVGIGTASPSYKLQVTGTVRASSFISDTTTYADFVFKPGYQLASLPEVEAAIQKHGHLPGIPSEAEAKAHGIDLTAMQVKLLQKLEEHTLHLIAHEKELRRLSTENAALQRELADLKRR